MYSTVQYVPEYSTFVPGYLNRLRDCPFVGSGSRFVGLCVFLLFRFAGAGQRAE